MTVKELIMNAIYLKYLQMIRNIHAVTKETLCIKPEEVPSLVSLGTLHLHFFFLIWSHTRRQFQL